MESLSEFERKENKIIISRLNEILLLESLSQDPGDPQEKHTMYVDPQDPGYFVSLACSFEKVPFEGGEYFS